MESDQAARETEHVPGSGFTVDDVFYTLFRHKWLLVCFTCLGLLAVGVVLREKPPRYESVAKVMVRYVLDSKANPSDPNSITPVGGGVESILSGEIEILSSLDVAVLAADTLPEEVLARLVGGSNRLAAAGVISSGIEVSPPRSTVLNVTFRHPDPEVVQPVLQSVLDTYTQKHREVHLGYGVLDEYFTRKRDELRTRVSHTEEKLKELKTQAKILSLDEAKRSYQGQIDRLTGELLTAETELAQARAVIADLPEAAPNTNEERSVSTPTEKVRQEKVRQYSETVERLELLKRRERELTLNLQFTAEHPSVRNVRGQIEELETQKSELEEAFPSLGSLTPAIVTGGTNSVGLDIAAQIANIRRLTVKVEKLGTLLSNIQTEAIGVMSLEPEIAQLERQRQQEEKDYQFYQANIERARMGEAGNGKIVNMSIVQHPTPPGLDRKKTLKLLGAAFCGCVGMGVALAFLIDLILDRTIRRSSDVKRHLGLPVVLSVPNTPSMRCLSLRRRFRKRLASSNSRNNGGQEETASTAQYGLAPWDQLHELRPFAEGLRERVITYFEVRNVNHKPKLVAVTGCHEGSGVTTLASGLAAALSKTGEGNVLLVDMNVEQGEAHSFYKGKPGFALADVLQPESRGHAQVEENLYLASLRTGANDKLAKVMPSHFMNLVPKLKASDYDYIIFDMPPVTPTSVTPRMASYMDMVLLVLESEKTGQQAARQAGTLMRESRANVAAVLNKHREYVPERLRGEL
jgi:uncharacterized protein involved in exopolysaccharide biosynthesis/Mrp family chromosome partitioning ATPase